MKAIKIAMSASLIVALSFLFIQCNNSKKYSRDLFVGTWREVRHGSNNSFDDKYAISLSLNKDNTFSLSIPSGRIDFSGTWSFGGIDTTTFLALKYNYHIQNKYDYDYYGGSDFYQYYFFKVNKAEQGKLYLVDMSNKYENERIKEHLFKPQE